MTQTIDPVFSSAVLSAPELALNDLDFDALSQAMGGLKGEVDKNGRHHPGGRHGGAVRQGRRQAARGDRGQAHPHLVGRGV